jgi:predicted transcriptional regulator
MSLRHKDRQMATKKRGRPVADEASIQTAVRWERAELERIDAYCASQRFSPTRSDVIRTAVSEFLDRETGKK